MTTHDWLVLIPELVRYLAWPLVIVVLALRFGPKLFSVLSSRTVDLQGFGLRAKVSAAEQQQSMAEENPGNQPAVPPPAQPPAAVKAALETLKQKIRTDLNAYPQVQRENVLIAALATSRLYGQHEFVYNRIFGSQIAGLKRLDEIGGATVEDAQNFFAPIPAMFPEIYKTYGFDGWLGFMVSNGLVARDGDNLKATEFGHDFLVYLREVRLTEQKAG